MRQTSKHSRLISVYNGATEFSEKLFYYLVFGGSKLAHMLHPTQYGRSKPRGATLQFLFSFLLTCSILLGIFWMYYFTKTASFVDEQLRNNTWNIPSTIYADSPELYPGKRITPEWLVSYLQRAGYLETSRSNPKTLEYAARRGGIVFRGRTSEEAILVQFGERGVERLMDLTEGKRLSEYKIDPLPISSVYGAEQEKRTIVKYEHIPAHLVQAVLSIEDRRFYKHRGVDWISVGRAAWNNLRSGSFVEGGSTLTQQFVKNRFLSPKRSLRRKLNEAVMALLIERKLDKKRILELYLNEIYLGQRGAVGIHGVEEASRLYFGKDVGHLTVPEAALLAGMIQAPQRYNPYQHPDAAKDRRNTVLRAMQKYEGLSAEDYASFIETPVRVQPYNPMVKKAPYFVSFVNRTLQSEYGPDEIQKGNFQVYTTLDLEMQKLGEQVLSSGLARIDKIRSRHSRKRVQGCLIAADPVTGAVKAFVGGRDYSRSQYDRITQAVRQPGSAFKPFVFAAAMEWSMDTYNHYFTPATMLPDEPWSMQYGKRSWEPTNYDNTYHGVVSSRRALAESMNIATARLAQEVGMNRIASLSRAFGLQNAKPYPSLALGAVDLTPWQLMQAYTAFANRGLRTQLRAVERITDPRGVILAEEKSTTTRVLSPQTAYIITDMMKSVITSGTGAAVRRLGFTRPAAGKTGTTNDFHDAWFIGFTPNLICLVWVGFDDNTPLEMNAAQAAVPIWTEFMRKATQQLPVKDFERPDHIVTKSIDPLTGKLASPYCPDSVQEVFIEGTEPTEYCNHYYDVMNGQYYYMPSSGDWITLSNNQIRFNEQTGRYEYYGGAPQFNYDQPTEPAYTYNDDSTHYTGEEDTYDQTPEYQEQESYPEYERQQTDSGYENSSKENQQQSYDQDYSDDQYSGKEPELESEQKPQHVYFAPEPKRRRPRTYIQVPQTESTQEEENSSENR